MSNNKEYTIRVWDSFWNTWQYENILPCITTYTREAAIRVAKDLWGMLDDLQIEIQVHVRTLTLGVTQMIGYIDTDGEFVECFC